MNIVSIPIGDMDVTDFELSTVIPPGGFVTGVYGYSEAAFFAYLHLGTGALTASGEVIHVVSLGSGGSASIQFDEPLPVRVTSKDKTGAVSNKTLKVTTLKGTTTTSNLVISYEIR